MQRTAGVRVPSEAAPEGASLEQLRPQDKEKVGNLLRELARAQRTQQQEAADKEEYHNRLVKLRSQNHEIIQVCCVEAPRACALAHVGG